MILTRERFVNMIVLIGNGVRKEVENEKKRTG